MYAYDLYKFLYNNSVKHLYFSYINLLAKELFISANKKLLTQIEGSHKSEHKEDESTFFASS